MKRNKKQKLIYGILGLGRFGFALATELHQSGAELIVLDKDEEKVNLARDLTENAYIVKNLEKKVLIETGIIGCDVVVVCIGEQIDTSILTTLNLTSLGIKKVIAKASSTEHGEILEKLGAEVVYPERDMGIRLANRLDTARTLDYIQLSEKINISKIFAPSTFTGKSVLEANLRGRFGINIIAIENSGELIEVVKPDYVFRDNDILYVVGSKDSLANLASLA